MPKIPFLKEVKPLIFNRRKIIEDFERVAEASGNIETLKAVERRKADIASSELSELTKSLGERLMQGDETVLPRIKEVVQKHGPEEVAHRIGNIIQRTEGYTKLEPEYQKLIYKKGPSSEELRRIVQEGRELPGVEDIGKGRALKKIIVPSIGVGALALLREEEAEAMPLSKKLKMFWDKYRWPLSKFEKNYQQLATTPERKKILDHSLPYIEELKSFPGVQEIHVEGSFLRNKAAPGDLDLLIRVNKKKFNESQFESLRDRIYKETELDITIPQLDYKEGWKSFKLGLSTKRIASVAGALGALALPEEEAEAAPSLKRTKKTLEFLLKSALEEPKPQPPIIERRLEGLKPAKKDIKPENFARALEKFTPEQTRKAIDEALPSSSPILERFPEIKKDLELFIDRLREDKNTRNAWLVGSGIVGKIKPSDLDVFITEQREGIKSIAYLWRKGIHPLRIAPAEFPSGIKGRARELLKVGTKRYGPDYPKLIRRVLSIGGVFGASQFLEEKEAEAFPIGKPLQAGTKAAKEVLKAAKKAPPSSAAKILKGEVFRDKVIKDVVKGRGDWRSIIFEDGSSLPMTKDYITSLAASLGTKRQLKKFETLGAKDRWTMAEFSLTHRGERLGNISEAKYKKLHEANLERIKELSPSLLTNTVYVKYPKGFPGAELIQMPRAYAEILAKKGRVTIVGSADLEVR